MGYKRKFTKRELKNFRKNCSAKWRSEKNLKSGQFNKESKPNVLDIKVEEPEVTCSLEEDHHAILLDHAYSRIAVKTESDHDQSMDHLTDPNGAMSNSKKPGTSTQSDLHRFGQHSTPTTGLNPIPIIKLEIESDGESDVQCIDSESTDGEPIEVPTGNDQDRDDGSSSNDDANLELNGNSFKLQNLVEENDSPQSTMYLINQSVQTVNKYNNLSLHNYAKSGKFSDAYVNSSEPIKTGNWFGNTRTRRRAVYNSATSSKTSASTNQPQKSFVFLNKPGQNPVKLKVLETRLASSKNSNKQFALVGANRQTSSKINSEHRPTYFTTGKGKITDEGKAISVLKKRNVASKNLDAAKTLASTPIEKPVGTLRVRTQDELNASVSEIDLTSRLLDLTDPNVFEKKITRTIDGREKNFIVRARSEEALSEFTGRMLDVVLHNKNLSFTETQLVKLSDYAKHDIGQTGKYPFKCNEEATEKNCDKTGKTKFSATKKYPKARTQYQKNQAKNHSKDQSLHDVSPSSGTSFQNQFLNFVDVRDELLNSPRKSQIHNLTNFISTFPLTDQAQNATNSTPDYVRCETVFTLNHIENGPNANQHLNPGQCSGNNSKDPLAPESNPQSTSSDINVRNESGDDSSTESAVTETSSLFEQLERSSLEKPIENVSMCEQNRNEIQGVGANSITESVEDIIKNLVVEDDIDMEEVEVLRVDLNELNQNSGTDSANKLEDPLSENVKSSNEKESSTQSAAKTPVKDSTSTVKALNSRGKKYIEKSSLPDMQGKYGAKLEDLVNEEEYYYCKFCKAFTNDLAYHLKRLHPGEKEVGQMFLDPERLMIKNSQYKIMIAEGKKLFSASCMKKIIAIKKKVNEEYLESINLKSNMKKAYDSKVNKSAPLTSSDYIFQNPSTSFANVLPPEKVDEINEHLKILYVTESDSTEKVRLVDEEENDHSQNSICSDPLEINSLQDAPQITSICSDPLEIDPLQIAPQITEPSEDKSIEESPVESKIPIIVLQITDPSEDKSLEDNPGESEISVGVLDDTKFSINIDADENKSGENDNDDDTDRLGADFNTEQNDPLEDSGANLADTNTPSNSIENVLDKDTHEENEATKSKDLNDKSELGNSDEVDVLTSTRKYFCKYCKQVFTNLQFHLNNAHGDEEEVKQLSELPRNSHARKNLLAKIREDGNRMFNFESDYKEVYLRELNKIKENINTEETQKYSKCPKCSKRFKTRGFSRHVTHCGARNRKDYVDCIIEDKLFADLERLVSELRDGFAQNVWFNLAKCLLTSLHFVNPKVVNIETVLITDFNKRRAFNPETDEELNDTYHKFEIKNLFKADRPPTVILQKDLDGMSVLLTSNQDEGISLLLKFRLRANVPKGSPYIFGSPVGHKETHVALIDAMQIYMKEGDYDNYDYAGSLEIPQTSRITRSSHIDNSLASEEASTELFEELTTSSQFEKSSEVSVMSTSSLVLSKPSRLSDTISKYCPVKCFVKLDKLGPEELNKLCKPSSSTQSHIKTKTSSSEKSGSKKYNLPSKKLNLSRKETQSLSEISPSTSKLLIPTKVKLERLAESDVDECEYPEALSPSNYSSDSSDSSKSSFTKSTPPTSVIKQKPANSKSTKGDLAPARSKRISSDSKTDQLETSATSSTAKVGTMVEELQKNIYMSRYLKVKRSSNTKGGLRTIDRNDLRLCKNCRKYFMKISYLKHKKICVSKPISGKRKRKTKDLKRKVDNKREDNSRRSTTACPTLQSPAGAKKYFCIFCKHTFTKLSRHLEHVHKEEEEVQEMLKFPKGSTDRDQILYKIRTRGTFTFNMNAEYNGGQLIVSRRPNPILRRTNGDFLPCPYCGNYFAKKTLYRHTKRCSNGEGLQKNVKKAAKAIISYIHPRSNKIMATQIIPRLIEDKVSKAIKSDELLVLLGNHLTQKHAAPKGRGYIRQNLRMAGKLLLALRVQNPSITEFSSIFNPEHCDLVIKTVMEVAHYIPEKNTFKLSDFARKLGPVVKICGEVWSMECCKKKYFDRQQMVVEFLNKFRGAYKREIYSKLKLMRTQTKLPTVTGELKRMFQFSQIGMLEMAYKLNEDFALEVWIDLVNYLLLHLRLLNNNIHEDGESLVVSDYLQRHSLDADEDVSSYHTLGLLANFPKNYLKVRLRDTPVYLLLSQEFCGAVDVLLENREDAGVPIENVYLFGKPEEGNSFFKTSEAKALLRNTTSSKPKPIQDVSVPKLEPLIPEEATIQSIIAPSLSEDYNLYETDLRKAFDHHSSRMLELREQLSQNFSNQVWIDLVKCVLTCVQLMNDKTFTEVVQYLLLEDFKDRQSISADESLDSFNSLGDKCGGYPENYVKINLQGTPINLLLSSEICNALDLLIRERVSANIHEENPYVFGCSGNKYNYYRTEGCIGSLPVSNGVEEILSLRLRIINDLAKNGTAGIQLSKLLPDRVEDLAENATRVFYYSQSKMVELKFKLEEQFSSEIWLDLIKCLLTYIQLLNDKYPDDSEKLKITDYNNRQSLDSNEDSSVYHSSPDDLNDFPQNYVKTKMGDSSHYLLLSLDFCETVDLLLKHRQDAGVHVDNPHVFGCRGSKENFFKAHGAIAQLAPRCGVRCLRYFKTKIVEGGIEMEEQLIEAKVIPKVEKDAYLRKRKFDQTQQPDDIPLDAVKTEDPNFSNVQRRRWTDEEMNIARKSFENCLKQGYLPSMYQCQLVVSENVELHNRTPEQLKAWVNNQIQKKVGRPSYTKSASGKRVSRCRWSIGEQDIVRLHFGDYLMSRTLPSSSECRKMISSNPEMSHRTPEHVRAWINNQNKKRNNQ